MTRMSTINRAWLTGLPGLFFAGISAWAETPGSETAKPVPVGYEQSSGNFLSAGYIRILEDAPVNPPEAATEMLALPPPGIEVKAPTTELQGEGVVATSKSDPAAITAELKSDAKPDFKSDPKPLPKIERGPIELAPLSTPSTSTVGVGTGIRPEDVTEGRLPPSVWFPTGETRNGEWSLQAKPWLPGGFCHQPLYFEDPMLERHGHERFPHFQPIISGVRFFGTIPVLPYLATLRHPLDDVHTLGSYRPGTPAPMLRYRAHYDQEAIRNQALSTAAAGIVLP